MFRTMSTSQDGSTPKPLASVLDPVPQLPEMSLRRTTALLKESNEARLVEILVQQGINIEQHTTPSISANPWARTYQAEGSRLEARYARKPLGTTAPESKTVILTPELRSEILSSLLSITADVTVFNPVGVFLLSSIPSFNELPINRNTTLAHLITSLQKLVDGMINHEKEIDRNEPDSNLRGPLLVSAVQFKIFNGGHFVNFPKISGILKGTNPVERPSSVIDSPTASAKQAAYRGGELEMKDTPCAESIQWLVGPDSIEEAYWEQYRIAMQIDKVGGKSTTTSAHSPPSGEKRPVIKVMTVQKYGLMSRIVGDHNFQICEPNINIPTRPNTVSLEENPHKKGKDRVIMGEGTLSSEPRDALLARYSAVDFQIHKSEIDFALDFATTLNNEDDSESKSTNQLVSRMMENGRELPLDIPINLINGNTARSKTNVNWGTYQRMGGNPHMHELFPLDNVPFKPQEFYMYKAKHDQGQEQSSQPVPQAKVRGKGKGKGKNRSNKSSSPPTPGLATFCPIDPNLVEMLMESKETVRQSKFKNRNELAVGFEDGDDDIFLGEKLSPAKPQTDGTLAPGPIHSTEPFLNFHSRQEHSPLQSHVGKVDVTRAENPFRGPRAGEYSEILTGLNVLTAGTDSFGNTSDNSSAYGFGNPLNGNANSFRSSIPRVTNSNIPRPNSRFFPTNNGRNPSPSPLTTIYMQTLHQPALNANQFSSFNAFNEAVHTQNLTQQNQSYWANSQMNPPEAQNWFTPPPAPQQNTQTADYYFSVSPIKTLAQIHRAFASAPPQPFNGRQSPFPGQNQHQRQGQMPGQTHAQGQNQVQNPNIPAINQPTAPSDTLTNQAADITPQYPGAAPTINATPNANTNSFNIGAGTSRAWVATLSNSIPVTARPSRVNTVASNSSAGRRLTPGQSQLRADSPAFNYTGGRTISTYLPGIYAAGNVLDGAAMVEDTPTKKGSTGEGN